MFNDFTSKIKELVNLPMSWFITLFLYGLGGLILGFLLKNYTRLFLLVMISCFLLLWSLEYFEIIIIKYDVVKELLSYFSVENFKTNTLFWIKHNVAFCISALIGFVGAWKFL